MASLSTNEIRTAFLDYFADNGHASVQMTEVAPEHPCASLSNSENLVTIISSRYANTPLVILGPGAGPQVTAAGVFADILRALAES